MKRDCGDILDRASIAQLKNERIGNSENEREHNAFKKEIKRIKTQYSKYNWDVIYNTMLKINSSIWFLEAAIKGDGDILPNPHHLDDKLNEKVLASIGKNTILIRNINSIRVGLKNIINSLVKEGFMDLKKDHLSEFKRYNNVNNTCKRKRKK